LTTHITTIEASPQTAPIEKQLPGVSGSIVIHMLTTIPLTMPVNISGTIASIAPKNMEVGIHRMVAMIMLNIIITIIEINMFQPGPTINQLNQPISAPAMRFENKSPSTKYSL